MKTNWIIKGAFAISFVVFFSCKKSDTAQNNGLSTKVKTYIEDATNSYVNSSDTFNVLYDASDRVVSLISSFSGAKFLYTYNGNASYTMDIMKNTHLIIRETCFINAHLLVDSTFQYNDTNDSSTVKLIYNAAGQQIQNRNYDYTTSKGAVLWKINDYTYDTNGNLHTDTDKGFSGSINSIATYTYTNIATPIFSMATMYRPAPYKNLPASISYFFPSGNNTESVAMVYTFDNNNRVISDTQTDSYGNVVVHKYIYY